jgi:hypothetical protein
MQGTCRINGQPAEFKIAAGALFFRYVGADGQHWDERRILMNDGPEHRLGTIMINALASGTEHPPARGDRPRRTGPDDSGGRRFVRVDRAR